MSDTDLPRSKAVMRGRMLVAWFAEASPQVLWRFVANDVSGGFGLRGRRWQDRTGEARWRRAPTNHCKFYVRGEPPNAPLPHIARTFVL